MLVPQHLIVVRLPRNQRPVLRAVDLGLAAQGGEDLGVAEVVGGGDRFGDRRAGVGCVAGAHVATAPGAWRTDHAARLSCLRRSILRAATPLRVRHGSACHWLGFPSCGPSKGRAVGVRLEEFLPRELTVLEQSSHKVFLLPARWDVAGRLKEMRLRDESWKKC